MYEVITHAVGLSKKKKKHPKVWKIQYIVFSLPYHHLIHGVLHIFLYIFYTFTKKSIISSQNLTKNISDFTHNLSHSLNKDLRWYRTYPQLFSPLLFRIVLGSIFSWIFIDQIWGFRADFVISDELSVRWRGSTF